MIEGPNWLCIVIDLTLVLFKKVFRHVLLLPFSQNLCSKFSPYHYFKKLQKLSYYLVFYVYKISVPMIVVLKSTARRQKISGFVSAGGLEFKINFACWNREFNPFYIFFIFSMQYHLYIAILLLYCLCFCIMYNVLHMSCLSKYVSYGIHKYFNIIPITSV